MKDYTKMSISELGIACARDWKNINYTTKLHLDALRCFSTINDVLNGISCRSIASFFLSKADDWEGEVAEGVKKELNRRLKYNPANVKIDKIVEVKDD